MNDGDDNYNCFLSITREKLRKTMCVDVGYITIFKVILWVQGCVYI